VRNWLGQNIEVGSVVGRGARQGNTSDFKLGVVTKLDEPNEKARVQWRYESSRMWHNEPTGKYYTDGWSKGKPIYNRKDWGLCPTIIGGSGSPSIQSLFLLSQNDLDRCDRIMELIKEKRERDEGMPMPRVEYEQRLTAII
jgi:hypothetical protein